MKGAISLLSLFFFFIQLFCQDMPNKLDAFFKSYYKANEPGAAVAIKLNGKVIFKRGYGLANVKTREKITTATNFNIGSLTKQFTAYCILKLAQQERLSLNDKLIKYFPGFNPKTGDITIQQLLTHSSGIMEHYAYVDKTVKHAVDETVLEAVKNIDSTYFAPGFHYRYSNTAYCLLALIIEKVSGLSYADFVKKNIFIPLGMNRSTVLKIGAPIDQRAMGYDIDSSHQHPNQFQQLDADESVFFSTEGDGGIYTSIDDYLKWCDALQSGNILSKALINKAHTAQVLIDTPKKLSYGYGWFISEKDSAKAIYHTGSNGGFRAIIFMIPSHQYTVVIFSNQTSIDLENLLMDINNVLHMPDKSFTKIESLVSFMDSWPIFAPCKEIPSSSILLTKNLSANGMALN